MYQILPLKGVFENEQGISQKGVIEWGSPLNFLSIISFQPWNTSIDESLRNTTIRADEFAWDALVPLLKQYGVFSFFYNGKGIVYPYISSSGATANALIYYRGTLSDVSRYIPQTKYLNLSFENSNISIMGAPSVSNQGSGERVSAVTMASENYQFSMSYNGAPYVGQRNKIYIPVADPDNQSGQLSAINTSIDSRNCLVKRSGYMYMYDSKRDQNMVSYDTQEIVPHVYPSIPATPQEGDIYEDIDEATFESVYYRYSNHSWTQMSNPPTFSYNETLPNLFADPSSNDQINGISMAYMPLSAVRTSYPECVTNWLWGFPMYLDTESTLNDLTSESVVSSEQGTENISISQDYAAKIIVGNSVMDELPASDPSTGNRYYDATQPDLHSQGKGPRFNPWSGN